MGIQSMHSHVLHEVKQINQSEKAVYVHEDS